MTQQSTQTKIVTPVGRLLQGDVFNGQSTNQKGEKYKYKTGAKAGQEYLKYACIIGIEKTNPEWPEFWAKIHAVAVGGMPHMFGPDGRELREFHWKYVDGDSPVPDQGGKAPKDKPGFAGCHVLRFTTNGYAPRVCDEQANLLTDPQSINRGDYIRIIGTVAPNGDTAKPGLYMEHKLVQRIGFGPRIETGIDPAKELANHAVGYIPQGVSSTPVAPAATPAMPGAPAAPQAPGYAAPPMAPGYAAPPAAQPVTPGYAAPQAGYTAPPSPPQGAPAAAFAPPAGYAAPPMSQPVAPGYAAPPATPGMPVNPAAGFLNPGQQ